MESYRKPDTDRLESSGEESVDSPANLSAGNSDIDFADARNEAASLRAELARKQKEIAEIRQQLSFTESLLSKSQLLLIQKEAELNKILASFGWRALRRYGLFKYHVARPAIQQVSSFIKRAMGKQSEQEDDYQAWASRCEAFRYDCSRALGKIERFDYRPIISIVMPVYNTPREYLSKAIDSTLNQYYTDWELCICDDASTARHVRETLEQYAARDARIKIDFTEKNGGIAVASNRALSLATGEFVGLLDHDDELTPDALFEVVVALQQIEADLIYSDEDKLDARGNRCEPFFKPAWSPDLLLSCNYVSHFGVYRKQLLDELGGFRAGFDGSQDYDLTLRFTEKTERIAHIPKILYHWRKIPASAAASAEAKPYAYEAAQAALADALRRRKIDGEAERGLARGYYRVRRRASEAEKVSIIIPTRDRLNLLRKCISSIESKTSYTNYEIIIVDNGSRNSATLEYLKRSPHRVIRHDGPFNFSRLNNLAAQQSTGDYLLMLNNDTEVITSEWLAAMVEHAQRREVGAVGAKLLYPRGQIQHAGVVLGIGGLADHAHRLVDGFTGHGYFNFPNIIRNYSAVTAACLMIRRELFNELEGFNEEELAVAFNDVDLCLRLREQGYLIVYTPYALLYHHESISRGNDVNAAESSYLRAHWHHELRNDPYYSPNFDSSKADFALDYSKPESLYCVSRQELADRVVGRAVEGRSIGQQFFVSEDNLCAIGINCAVSGRKKQGRVRMRLRESRKSKIDLAVVEVEAAAIRAGQHNLFHFDAIRGSGGNTFYFYVEFASHSPDSSLDVFGSSITSEAIGPHLQNHSPSDGTVSFKAYCLTQYRLVNLPPNINSEA